MKRSHVQTIYHVMYESTYGKEIVSNQFPHSFGSLTAARKTVRNLNEAHPNMNYYIGTFKRVR